MELKSYWVDFECFQIQAKNKYDAYSIAEKMLKDGTKLPQITNVEWTGEEIEEDPADMDDRLYHEEQDHIAMEKAKENK